MSTTSKPTTDPRPSTTVSGTIARQGRWCVPPDWLGMNWYLDGQRTPGGVFEVLGPSQIGFVLPQERNYGNG